MLLRRGRVFVRRIHAEATRPTLTTSWNGIEQRELTSHRYAMDGELALWCLLIVKATLQVPIRDQLVPGVDFAQDPRQ